MRGTLTTDDPTYDAATGVLTQTMRFTSKHKIGGEEIVTIVDHACRLFKGTLILNGLTDHAWPPDRVAAHPASDFRSGFVTLETRASKPPAQALIA